MFSKMTCVPTQGQKMLNIARLGNAVSSVDCSNPDSVTMTFKDQHSYQAARQAWAWADKSADNYVVAVLDGDCGGPNGRSTFKAGDITYDENSRQATLSGEKTAWDKFMEKGSLKIRSTYPEGTGMSKRQAKGSVSLAQQFNRNILSIPLDDISTLNLDCLDCATSGSLDFEADLDFGLFDGFSLSASVTTKDNVGLHLGMGLTLEAQLADGVDIPGIQLLSFPLGGINVPGLGSLGPSLSVIANGNIGAVTASLTAGFGGSVTIPNDVTLRVGGDEGSDAFEPVFQADEPTLSGAVTVTADVAPAFVVGFEAKFLKFGGSFGAALRAPKFDLTASVEASTAGVCDDPTATAGATFSANIGAEVVIFAGGDSIENLPNAVTVISRSQELFNKCFPFGGGEQPVDPVTEPVPVSAPADGLNGNDGSAPKRGTLQMRNPEQTVDWFYADGNQGFKIESLQDGQTIGTLTLDDDGAGSTCIVFQIDDDCTAPQLRNVPQLSFADSGQTTNELGVATGCLFCAFG
jgi:hypothetical protein